MNSAARFLNQGTLSRTWVVSVILAKTQYSVWLLAIGVLMSALSVVYVTNTAREFNASLQQSLIERDQLHVQWSQLLLERSTWVTQSRVEQIASNKLDMEVPDSKTVVIVSE
jgi:cell division protein FtsL